MTDEEIEIKEKEYNSKFINTKALRAELVANFRKIVFDPAIKINCLSDVIWNTVNQRKATYFQDDNTLQTADNKRRSIEDIYRIQKSYNINCSLKDLRRALDSLVEANLITFVFCKQTLVNTYSRNGYSLTQKPEIYNAHLDKININPYVKPEIIKKKKLFKKKIYA